MCENDNNITPRNPQLGFFNNVRYYSQTYMERTAAKCRQLYEMLEYLTEKTGAEYYASNGETNMDLAKRTNGECYFVTFFRGSERRVFCFRNVPNGVQFRWEVDLQTGNPIRKTIKTPSEATDEPQQEESAEPEAHVDNGSSDPKDKGLTREEIAIRRISEDWWIKNKERLIQEIEMTSAKQLITLDRSWRLPGKECLNYLQLFVSNITKGAMRFDSIAEDGTGLIAPASFYEEETEPEEISTVEIPIPSDEDVPEEKEQPVSVN